MKYIKSRHRIRKVSSNGIITTVAGNGSAGFSGDGGPATEAQLNDPTDVAVDSSGNIYFSDTGNRRIRKVTCPHGADLSITKTVRPAQQGRSIMMGRNIYYVITVRNNGPELATNMLVEDVLPSGLNFMSVAATSDPPFECSYENGSRRVRCAVPALLVGYNYQINLIVTSTRIGKIVNSASILSEVEDTNEANNRSSYTVNVVTGK